MFANYLYSFALLPRFLYFACFQYLLFQGPAPICAMVHVSILPLLEYRPYSIVRHLLLLARSVML